MLTQLQDLAEQTIQDLRRMTRALRPSYLEELGLVAALEMLAREIEQSRSLGVDFQRIGIEKRLATRSRASVISNCTRSAQQRSQTRPSQPSSLMCRFYP